MSTTTQFQQLTKPDLVDAADITVINTNFDKIDKIGTVICTSATRPTTNLFDGLQIYETDTKRRYIYNGSAWKCTYDPGVEAQVTASSASTSGTTELVLASAAIAANYDGTTEIEVAFSWYNVTLSVASDVFLMKLYDGASAGSGTQLQQGLILGQNSTVNGGTNTIRARVTPASAAKTYTARLVRSSGTGTGALFASGSAPAILSVKAC